MLEPCLFSGQVGRAAADIAGDEGSFSHTKPIYTIGHSDRQLDEFLGVLTHFGIEVLVDVRRFPTSKWDWFKRENLAAALALKGIRYVHMGEELGGFRKAGYQEYMKSETFAAGIERLVKMAGEQRVAIMCAERMVFRCHRRFISTTLQSRGFDVIHIVDKQRTIQLRALDSV